MRLFFLMLLLLNGVFLVVNMLSAQPELQQLKPVEGIAPLVLLSELKQQAAEKIEIAAVAEQSKEQPKQKEAVTAIEQESAAKAEPVKEDSSIDLTAWLANFTSNSGAKEELLIDEQNISELDSQKPKQAVQQCFTAGPFQSSEKLQQAASFFNNFDIEYQHRSIEEKQYIGMLVYLPSHSSRKVVVAVAEELVKNGVKDYMLLNEPGKTHALSLGVFGLKKNAEQRVATLAKLKYQAQTEPRYKKKIIYWLDYSILDSEDQIDLAAQQMKVLNVSQIERNCKS